MSPAAADPAAVLAAACRELARLPDVLQAVLGGLDADTWRVRPVPAEWSAIEIVCHLRDEEVEDVGARFSRSSPRRLARVWADRGAPLRAPCAGPIPCGS
jgi:hypothetical protein